jgi:hypothetical protein
MKRRKLPAFDSIKRLARFWDTHDLTDFEDQLEEVSEPVFVRSIPITVRLQPDSVELLRRIAKAKGSSPEEPVRERVLQQLARRKARAQKRSAVSRRVRPTKK